MEAPARTFRHVGWPAVATMCVGAFLGQLDIGIATLTYGPLESAFGIRQAAVQWVSLAYLLALVVSLVPAGWISEARDRKAMALSGFALLAAASAACALAPNLQLLIAFRVVQAAGAALVQANSTALIAASVPEDRTRSALGARTAAQGLGLALGPLAGGLLVGWFGWPSVFWLNVPAAAAALLAGLVVLPRVRVPEPASGFDRLGLTLVAVAGTYWLVGLTGVSGLAVPAGLTVMLLLSAAGASAVFVRGRATHGMAGEMCGFMVLVGPLIAVPSLLTVHGAALGAVPTTLPAGFVLAGWLVPPGRAEVRRGPAGAAVALGALVGLMLLPLTAAAIALLLLVLGAGLGVHASAGATWSAGAGESRVATARGLGAALGVALVTFAMHLGRHHYFSAPPSRDAFAALTVVGVVLLYAAVRSGTTGCASPPRSAGNERKLMNDENAEQRRWAGKYGRRVRPGSMDGILFPVVATGEVCFRQGSAAADLRAASEWLESNPGWHLRSLRYEQSGAAHLAALDEGSESMLWLLVEQREQT